MKQVLFCINQSFLKDLIRINFRHSQFIQPIVTESSDEAQALFDLTQDIDIIITQSNTAYEINEGVKKNNRPCKLIVIGDDPKLSSPYDLFPMNQIRDVFNILREKYGGVEVEDVSKDNCVSMPAHLFLHFTALPKKEQEHVNKYAQKSAELVGTYPAIPTDVVKIIMQHHGSLNGIGLPSTPQQGSHHSQLFL